MDGQGRLPLLVIAGTTASGKTECAVRVAEEAGGEIVNADSMQVYRGLEVGTAKPTAAQRQRARFHLVDVVEPDQPYSVALYQQQARAAIAGIAQRGRLPILCGGTGLYLRAVTQGFDFPPGERGSSLRQRLEAEMRELGPEAMHARLAALDPAAAARTHPHNRQRVIRALEIAELPACPGGAPSRAGGPPPPGPGPASVDAPERIPYNAAKFVLTGPREALYARIERRVDEMLAAGWLEEVRRLLARGLSPELQSLQALGYGHLARHVAGETDLAEARRLIQRDTRRYAKRQLTWFRREPDGVWLSWATPGEWEELVAQVPAAARRLCAAETWRPNETRPPD